MSRADRQWPHPWRRVDSFFARALLIQTLVAVVLLGVFGTLLYVERSVAIGHLEGERWAPALRMAAGHVPGAQTELPPVLHRTDRPQLAVNAFNLSPRVAAFTAELRRRGLTIIDTLIAPGDEGPTLWLLVRTAQGTTAWLGLSDEALLPSLLGRLVPVLLMTLALIVGSSWFLMRRLTRPLERLRARMAAHQPGLGNTSTSTLLASPADAAPEVKAIEAAYDDLLARFENHQRERSLLLAGVSHDLRSPLARIRMAASLLPDDSIVAPEAIGDVSVRRESIIRNATLLEQLIESFLDQVRAGELALDQPVDLAEVARATAARLARPPGELTLIVPSSLIISDTHPLLIERLLSNLLDNAFVHGKTPVQLRLSRLTKEGVDSAELEVIDAGPGIPAGSQQQLLQAFARGDSSRGKPGTGLGLSIVARVVHRMGGTLSFDQGPPSHRVRVSLPMHKSQA